MSDRSFPSFLTSLATLACLALASSASAADPPQWPRVNLQMRCTFNLPDGTSGPFNYAITRLDGQPHHNLRRGDYRIFDDNGYPTSEPLRVDLAYKPDETPQPGSGSIFEWTSPQQGIQCKEFLVRDLRFPFGYCYELQTFKRCSGPGLNGLTQSCRSKNPVPCQ